SFKRDFPDIVTSILKLAFYVALNRGDNKKIIDESTVLDNLELVINTTSLNSITDSIGLIIDEYSKTVPNMEPTKIIIAEHISPSTPSSSDISEEDLLINRTPPPITHPIPQPIKPIQSDINAPSEKRERNEEGILLFNADEEVFF